jgi:hypothetical protein
MSPDLRARHFLVLPEFVSRMRAVALARALREHHAAEPLKPDTLVPGAPAVHDFLPFVRLLVEKIPQVEAAAGERLLPTYTYARLYGHGQALRLHEDRDACELSLSLNLDADEPWPIWFKPPDGQVVAIAQQPGDAVLYLGCQTPHWREPYTGQSCAQVFLHYVFAFGDRAYAYFDKKRFRGA